MRSEGFPFIVRGLGVGPVFASRVSSRRLPSSLVVCRRFGPACRHDFVPMGKVPKDFIFGCFKCDVASFRVAGVARCDMWTCCCPRRKSPCLWGKLKKTCFRRCQNVKIEMEVSHEMLVLTLPRVSS